MKIGILTLPIAENYGGILQAIALYRYLHKQGHDVVLIYKAHDQNYLKRVIKSILLSPIFSFLPLNRVQNHKEWQERKAFHRPFIEKEIYKISQDFYTKEDLESFAKKENFDAVIVGSDQVWRKAYINDIYYKSYFFDFIDSAKTKKIAYAASFGKDHWEGKDDIEDISKLLADFTAISTREKSGVGICKDSFGYENAKHVLDPTMLMSKEFYLDEIVSKYDTSKIKKGGLLTYVLDEEYEKKKIIDFIKEKTDSKEVNHLKGFNKEKTTFSVPQWLASFANADFVVTDSFHGMVFSIIFEKNFVVIGNEGRGMDRFTSLLPILGLEDRLIFAFEDLKDKKFEKIDYVKVKEILKKQREKSVGFFSGVLSANK